MTYKNLTQTEKDSLREQTEKDGKALLYIHQSMHEIILPIVATTSNANKAWDTLETSYQGLGKVKNYKLQILKRYFESMSMKYSESANSFYTKFIGLIIQLKSHGESI